MRVLLDDPGALPWDVHVPESMRDWIWDGTNRRLICSRCYRHATLEFIRDVVPEALDLVATEHASRCPALLPP